MTDLCGHKMNLYPLKRVKIAPLFFDKAVFYKNKEIFLSKFLVDRVWRKQLMFQHVNLFSWIKYSYLFLVILLISSVTYATDVPSSTTAVSLPSIQQAQKQAEGFLSKNSSIKKIENALNIHKKSAELIYNFALKLKNEKLEVNQLKAIEKCFVYATRHDKSGNQTHSISAVTKLISNLEFLNPHQEFRALFLSLLTKQEAVIDFLQLSSEMLDQYMIDLAFFKHIATIQKNHGIPDLALFQSSYQEIREFVSEYNKKNSKKTLDINSLMEPLSRLCYSKGIKSLTDLPSFLWQLENHNPSLDAMNPSLLDWLELIALFIGKQGLPDIDSTADFISYTGFYDLAKFKKIKLYAKKEGFQKKLPSKEVLNALFNDFSLAQLKEICVKYNLLTAEDSESILQEKNENVLSYFSKDDWFQQHILYKRKFTANEVTKMQLACIRFNQKANTKTTANNLEWFAKSLFVSKEYHLLDSQDLLQLLERTLSNLESRAPVTLKQKIKPLLALISRTRLAVDELDFDKKVWLKLSKQVKKLMLETNKLKRQAVHPGLNSEDCRILELFSFAISAQLTDLALEEFKGQLRVQLESLQNSGSATSINVAFELGVAGAHIVSGSGGVKMSLTANASDATSISVTKCIEPSLSLQIGESVLTFKATGSASYGKGKGFGKLESLVDYYAGSMLMLLLGTKTSLLSNIKGLVNANNAEKMKRNVGNFASELSNKLIRSNIIFQSERVCFTNKKQVDYIEIIQKTISGSASVSVGLEALNTDIGMAANAKMTTVQFKKRFDFIDIVKKHPEALKKNMAYFRASNLQILGQVTSKQQLKTEKESLLWYEGIKARIQAVKQFKVMHVESSNEIQSVLMENKIMIDNSLEHLFSEYQMYSQTLNDYDLAKSENKNSKGLHNLKHSMEKSRGVKGRANMMKSFIVSHVALCQLYEQIDVLIPDAEPGELMRKERYHKMCSMYETPTITLSKGDRKKLSVFLSKYAKGYQASGKIHAQIAPVSIPGIDAPSLGAEITRGRFNDHFISEMSGDDITIDLSFRSGVKTGQILRLLNKAVKNIPKSQAIIKAVPKVQDWDILDNVIDEGILRFCFADTGYGFTLRYIRLLKHSESNVSTSALPIFESGAASVTGKVSLQYSKTQNVSEQIGNNTLFYLFLRYNGWLRSHSTTTDYEAVRKFGQTDLQKTNQDALITSVLPKKTLNLNKKNIKEKGKIKNIKDPFDAFLVKHRKSLAGLLSNLNKESSNAGQELREHFEHEKMMELNDSEEFQSQFKQSIHQYDLDPTVANYRLALADLSEFLARSSKIFQSNSTNAFAYPTSGEDQTDGAAISIEADLVLDDDLDDSQAINMFTCSSASKSTELRRSARIKAKQVSALTDSESIDGNEMDTVLMQED